MISTWIGEVTQQNASLPPWWPIAVVVIPLVVAIIVAIIQMSGVVKSARIASEAKGAIPPEKIAEEVARVLGTELDKRLGKEAVAGAQAAFAQGKEEAEAAARELIEAHERAIQDLQAQLAARDAEPVGGQSETLAAVMLYNAGLDAQKAGTLGEAIGLYSAAIKIDPKHAKAFYNRGNAKFAMGDKRAAIEDYDAALALDPNNFKALYNCGNAKSDLGEHEGAIQDYTEAIRLSPDFGHAYYNRGNSRSALGDGAGAMSDYEETVRLDPTFAAAYYNIACEAAKTGDEERSIANLRTAFDLDSRWTKQARIDPDLASLVRSAEFAALFEDHVVKVEPPKPESID